MRIAVSILVLSLLAPGAVVRAQLAAAPLIDSLQGSWAGIEKKYSLTIKGNSLRYQGERPNETYEATFTLPDGTFPRQIHATITASEKKDDIGVVVKALLKIEDGTLTIVGFDPNALGVLDPFLENDGFRYDLRKAEPPRPE